MKNLFCLLITLISSVAIGEEKNTTLAILCSDFKGFSNTLTDGKVKREKDAYSNQEVLLVMDLTNGTGTSTWSGRNTDTKVNVLAGGIILQVKDHLIVNYFEAATEVFRVFSVFLDRKTNQLTTTMSESQLRNYSNQPQSRGFMSVCTSLL